MKSIILLMGLFLFVFNAHSGVRVGNGGGAWVCRDKVNVDIRWMWLTDLFEAEVEFGLSIKRDNTIDAKTRADLIIDSIHDSTSVLQPLMDQYAVNLDDVIQFTPGHAVLAVINDGLHRVLPSPESCAGGFIYYGQIANFTDDGRLLISESLWNQPSLTETDKAALLIHEVIYKVLRDAFNDRNSVRARQIVGILFSDLDDSDINKKISAVLETPAPPGEEANVDLMPLTLTCSASLQSESGTETLILNRAGRALGTNLGLYRFFVLTVPGLMTPAYMSIEDDTRGVGSAIDSAMLEPAFGSRGAASLTLKNNGEGEKAVLSCWLEGRSNEEQD